MGAPQARISFSRIRTRFNALHPLGTAGVSVAYPVGCTVRIVHNIIHTYVARVIPVYSTACIPSPRVQWPLRTWYRAIEARRCTCV